MLDPVNSLKSGFLPNFICSLIMVKNISQPQFWRFCTCRYYDIIIIKLIIMFIENISSLGTQCSLWTIWSRGRLSSSTELKLSCKSRSMWQKWFNFNSLIRSLFIKSTLKWMVGWRFLFRFNRFQEERCAGSACQCTNWNRLEPIWNLKESAEIRLKICLKWFRAHIRKLRKNRLFDHGRIF